MRRTALAAVLSSALIATACSNPDGGSTSAEGASDADKNDTVVLLTGDELGQYNPIGVHGRSGDSHIFEGLYRVEPGVVDKQPELQPVLAAGPATANSDNTVWTVPVASGIKFSDGTDFGPEDVVATFKAIQDERSASEEASTWDFVKSVEEKDGNVVFTLERPFAEFPRLLLNGIAPSEAFDFNNLGPAEDSELNTKPVGTGPYKLESLRADEAVLTARDDYRAGAPEVKKIVVRHAPDENSRAQQIKSGEGDGTILEPKLALDFDGQDGYTVTAATSADWRGITLPSGNPFTGDAKVRQALNYAIDRDAMVRDVLDGKGHANSTFFASFYGKAFDKDSQFTHDQEKAEKLLDEAGWTKGADGIREKDGQKASFDIIYFPNRDAARLDLTLATVSDLKKIGVEANPVAIEPKNISADQVHTTPVMLGGGELPYTVDSQIYRLLHGKYAVAGQGGKFDNASDYSNPAIDALLDAARSESDADKRDELYRSLQREYIENPAMLQIAYVDHMYVTRDQGYKTSPLVLEPHSHGVTFGPWLHINEWTKK
ncbi:hypothetical protein CAQU_08185 [Corynebacterium aquilae DSM 44791]|uniref:Solute-binding protein family 5 domain-containing protein n=2 Tax=Corynebacterium aquilae TaxID=203263 RepID=A0A1L7CH28_9CORY|nr:hypothetical protein CAQU_08185 [Corynebacterium aquilae DSM 44791]